MDATVVAKSQGMSARLDLGPENCSINDDVSARVAKSQEPKDLMLPENHDGKSFFYTPIEAGCHRVRTRDVSLVSFPKL